MTRRARHTLPLREIADLRNGLNFKAAQVGNGVRVIGVSEIKNPVFREYGALPQVTVLGTLPAADFARSGDILFVRSNGNRALVGRSTLLANVPVGVTHSGFTIRARPDVARVDPRYLYYALNSATSRRAMRRLAGGSNISNISQEILGDIPIYVPSLGEQHAVVSGLEPFDDALELITRLVGAKRRFSRGVRQQLLTGRLRLPGFRTPWTEYLLGSLFVERVELYRGNLPLLSITSERGVVPRDDLDRRDTSSVDKSRYLRIAPGDIGYNTMRMWQGVSALSGLEGIVSPAYTIVVPGPKVDGRFAAALFKFPSVVNLFRRNSQGLVDDTLTLKFHNFARIRLRFPPIEEQRAISAMFATLDAEIELLPKLLRALNRQKGALLDKLLSGELQLPTK